MDEQSYEAGLDKIDRRLTDIQEELKASTIPADSWAVISDILRNESVVASYIHGADETFAALTATTSKASRILRVTRLAPRSIATTNVSYMNAVYRSVKDPDINNKPHVREYLRLVAVNNHDKKKDVVETILRCYGAPMDIYLTLAEYGFEMLLADSSEAYIMFSDEKEQISSALYLRGGDLVIELEKVFDSMLHRQIIDVINCSEINESNLSSFLRRIDVAWGDAISS